MCAAIKHRGPDDEGIWYDENAGIGLGHVRLSVLDLSPAGHQPMHSPAGRYVIVFNGEIYNHLVLRRELEKLGHAPQWRGHSDTETLLAGFDYWGIEATVSRSVGMFAFAAWDRGSRSLTLGRDRIGEKPLYYGWQGDLLLFGSEIKALRAHPAFDAAIDRDALTLFMRHNYIPAPYSIYRGIRKVVPGALTTVSLDRRQEQSTRYWDLRDVVAAGLERPFRGDRSDAVSELDTRLRGAIRGQMTADVPLGAFLSGGIDSSTIVALMQQESSRPIRTFTIGFHEAQYDEAQHAKAVARHLGTDHTELYVTPEQALEVVPRLPTLYCEPFADSSQIPTFLLSQLARRDVTVALSGDAGDELFAGYTRYALGRKLWSRVSLLPFPLRSALAHLINTVPSHRLRQSLAPLEPLLPAGLSRAILAHKLKRGAAVIDVRSAQQLYHQLVSLWTEPEDLVISGNQPETILSDRDWVPRTSDFVRRMMALDTVTYLPDDILVKVDRAAMGVSLETRIPLLDHRLVEFAWTLPLDFMVQQGVSKWPLREVLHQYVPKGIVDRPKMGFGVPIDLWLRGPLRAWAEELLAEPRLRREGYFRPGPIRTKWLEHVSGVRNWQYHIWAVLMFQAWLQSQT